MAAGVFLVVIRSIFVPFFLNRLQMEPFPLKLRALRAPAAGRTRARLRKVRRARRDQKR